PVMQGRFDRCHSATTDQSRRNDLGIVEDQEIAWLQQLRQVEKPPVLQPIAENMQQAAGIARHRGAARDQLRRQLEIEIGKAHGWGKPIAKAWQSGKWG